MRSPPWELSPLVVMRIQLPERREPLPDPQPAVLAQEREHLVHARAGLHVGEYGRVTVRCAAASRAMTSSEAPM